MPPTKYSRFTADANSSIYKSNVNLLNKIKEKSLNKYHAMMHDLYVLLTYVDPIAYEQVLTVQFLDSSNRASSLIDTDDEDATLDLDAMEG